MVLAHHAIFQTYFAICSTPSPDRYGHPYYQRV